MATSRGSYKTQRSVIGADGLPIVKEFVQRKGESKRAVTQRANEWAVAAKGKTPSPSMILDVAIDLYLEYRKADLEAGIIQPPTYRADRTAAQHLRATLGAVPIASLDSWNVEALLRNLSDKRRTAKSVRDVGKALYKWLIKRKWTESNPFQDARPVSYEPNKYEEPMSEREVWNAIGRVEHPVAKAVLATLACSGLRPKSVRELLWRELVDDNGNLFVLKSKAKRASGTRPVYVSEPAASMIRALPKTSLFVFPNPKTDKPYGETWLCDEWRKVRPNDRGPYDIKHFEVTRLAELGWADRDIAARVGVTSEAVIRSNYVQFARAKMVKKLGTRSERKKAK